MKRLLIIIVFLFNLYYLSAQDPALVKRVKQDFGKDVVVGKQWLVMIAIDNYQECKALTQPVREARQLRDVLTERFYFDEVVELTDDKATCNAMRDLFDGLNDMIGIHDSLILFYSGHGYVEKKNGNTYWLPIDAGKNRRYKNNWINQTEITGLLENMRCRHISLIIDSCFSGSIFKDLDVEEEAVEKDYGGYKNRYQAISREALTSATDKEKSPDQSEFMVQLIKALENSHEPYIDLQDLYVQIKRGKYQTQPLHGNIKNSGHQAPEAGFVLFMRDNYLTDAIEKVPVEKEIMYGGIELKAVSAGKVYLNDVFKADIRPSEKIKLDGLEVGTYEFKVVYGDEQEEVQRVVVGENESTVVVFTHVVVDKKTDEKEKQESGKPVLKYNENQGKLIWKFKTGDSVYSSPAVIDGRVYVGSVDKYLYCIDALSGKETWKFTTGDPVYSSPVIVDGRVYIGSHDHYLYCVDALSGKEIWKFKTGDDVYTSPVIVDGRVYVGSKDNHLYCIDALSGKETWKFKTRDGVYSSPVIVDGRVYVGSNDSYLYCVDALSGKETWKFKTRYSVYSSPVIVDGRVYVGSNDSYLYCLDALSGKETWNFTTSGDVNSSPVVVDGRVYVGSGDNHLYCLDALSDKETWKFKTGGYISSSPVVVDGRVYVGSNDDYLYCLDALSGKETWKFETEGDVYSSPAVVDGRVYVGSHDSYLYCIDTGVRGINAYNNKSGQSKSFSKPSSPPVLEVKAWVDTGSDVIYIAPERGLLQIAVSNYGKAVAQNVSFEIKPVGAIDSFDFITTPRFNLAPEETKYITGVFAANGPLTSGDARFTVRAVDPYYKMHSNTVTLAFPVLGVMKHDLNIAGIVIDDDRQESSFGNNNSEINEGEIVDIIYELVNNGPDMAMEVSVAVFVDEVPGITLLTGENIAIGNIMPGGNKPLVLRIALGRELPVDMLEGELYIRGMHEDRSWVYPIEVKINK